MKCPYCAAEDDCEHLLVVVDTTFREATNGPLYSWFNAAWSDILEEHDEDDDFREAEPFDELVDTVDSAADAYSDGEFDETPGTTASLRSFYCSTRDRVADVVTRLASA